MNFRSLLFSVILFSSQLAHSQFCESDQCPVTEKSYNQMIQKLEALYPQIEIIADWEEDRPQAFASFKRMWISGGFARKKDINRAGFLTVACHEVGHALLQLREGQADHFATKNCMKDFWQGDDHLFEVSQYKMIEPEINDLCSLQSDSNLCSRLLTGALNAANADKNRCLKNLANLNKNIQNSNQPSIEVKAMEFRCLRTSLKVNNRRMTVKFLKMEVPLVISQLKSGISLLKTDQRIVKNTYHQHNSPQCRMDTLKLGALNRMAPKCWLAKKVEQ